MFPHTSIKTRYLVLREVTILMGLAEYCLLFLWGYYTGQGSEFGLWLFGVLAANYWLSSHIGYTVLELLVRIQNGER